MTKPHETHTAWTLFAFTALLLMTGCAHQSSLPAPPVASPAATDKQIVLTFTPAAPRALDPVVFTVQITDKSGKPIADAKVKANLTMPDMEMPPNTVPLLPTASGIYTGQGRFTMADKWAVTVTVIDKGKQTVQTFPVVVR